MVLIYQLDKMRIINLTSNNHSNINLLWLLNIYNKFIYYTVYPKNIE